MRGVEVKEMEIWVGGHCTDAKNAFGSFCRTKMWGRSREHFPNLAALGRLNYGEASSAIFVENDT